jgi:hypothetical protein
LVWADKAIHEPFRGAVPGREDFSTLRTKAAVLTAMGRDSDANAVMDKALHMPVTDVAGVHQYGMSLLGAGEKNKAMEVLKLNAQQHPRKNSSPMSASRAVTPRLAIKRMRSRIGKQR